MKIDINHTDNSIEKTQEIIPPVRATQDSVEFISINLPIDYIRTPSLNVSYSNINFEFSDEESNTIKAFSQKVGVSVEAFFTSLLHTLLYRYDSQENNGIGIVLEASADKSWYNVINFESNTSFEAILSKTQLAYTSHDLLKFSTDKTPQVLLTSHDTNNSFLKNLKFELLLEVKGRTLSMVYATGLFDAITIERLLQNLVQLATAVIEAPKTPVSQLDFIHESEKQTLFTHFNPSAVAFSKTETIVELIEKQANESANATAIYFDDSAISYKELNEKANQVARALVEKGIGKDTFVGVLMERKIEMVISMLAILKAGGAYVPIDPTYPQDRINYIIEDSNAPIIISSLKCQKLADTNAKIIVIETLLDEIQDYSVEDLNNAIGQEDLAYVIYTSGSTGKPKGVLIEHKNVFTFIGWCQSEFNAARFSTILAGTSICFDLSVFEIFYPLCIGKSLRIIENGLSIPQVLGIHNDVLINTVPSVVRTLLNDGVEWKGVTMINMAGEPIPVDVTQRLDLANIEVRNLYGPSEDTTYSTIFHIKTPTPILIGKPIANTQVYILDKNQQLCPIGVSGELCIASDGLSRGYLNKAELTNEKFIVNPFDSKSKIYKTGDLAKWNADGNLEYLGRIDHQVKIRGFRIELGEIESVLLSSNLVSEAVVVAQEDANGNKFLAGYIVPVVSYQKEGLLDILRKSLPEYMIPSYIKVMTSLPLTSNGKIDRKALPKISASDLLMNDYTIPATDTERIICEIWERILNISGIGSKDSFFEIGGQSLLATRVVSALKKKFNIDIKLREVFDNPRVNELAKLIDSKLKTNTTNISDLAGLNDGTLAISSAQEQLWFIDQFEGSEHYHIPMLFELGGEVDAILLESAFKKIIDRHQPLRSVYIDDETGPYLELIEANRWRLGFHEINAENSLKNFIDRQIRKSFELSRDFMLRADLIRTESGHQLLIVMHHIASDGWSIDILKRELTILYNSNLNAALLPTLPIQCSTYAKWQKEQIETDKFRKSLRYWTKELGDNEPIILPTDFSYPKALKGEGKIYRHNLPKELVKNIEIVSNQMGMTPYMFMLSAFKVLLFRYCGQNDISIASPIAGRQHEEVEGLIGMFVNTIVLRSYIDGYLKFSEIAEELKEKCLKSYEHQIVPFEKITEAIGIERNGRHPIFQVMFAMQNFEGDSVELMLNNLIAKEIEIELPRVKFEMLVEVNPRKEGDMLIRLEYSTELFKESTIGRLLKNYQTLLESIVQNPNNPIDKLRIVDLGEAWQLTEGFNQTQRAFFKEDNLVHLFEKQVLKTPTKPAVIFENQAITYNELNSKANQVANKLIEKGIKSGQRVGILANRSIEMIVSIWGTLKCGGVYVPLNTAYPQEQLDHIINDAQIEFILCTNDRLKYKIPHYNAQFIDYQDIKDSLEESSNNSRSAESSAYIMYTSGTTGKPKGIEVTDRNIIKLAFDTSAIAINQDDKVLQWSNFAFDGSTYDIFSTLLNGGQLHLISEAIIADVEQLAKKIIENEISVCFMTTALFNAFVETRPNALKKLRKVLFGGEKVSLNHVEKALKIIGRDKIVHVYGPTETTTYATYYEINQQPERETIPIGYPLDNTQIYLLNTNLELAPIGGIGEIYIGGDGVAKGYLNNEKMTNEKFITTTFHKEKLYKTGDWAIRLADGSIEFIGRVDEQVKIRGYRIELSEIEYLIRQYKGVYNTVIQAIEDPSGTKQLVGYLITEGNFDKMDLVNFLKVKLPEYMIPTYFIELKELPLTPNGKVNKKALPLPNFDEVTIVVDSIQNFDNETERAISEIWSRLLKKNVDITANFFEVGGHSLLATRVVSAIRSQFNTEISIKDFFNNPTIKQLAQFLESKQSGQTLAAIVKQEHPNNIPLSYSQERLWFIHQLEGSQHYHVPIVLNLTGSLNIFNLEKALKEVIFRHEILRTRLYEVDGFVYQSVMRCNNWKLDYFEPKNQQETDKCIEKYINKPFDLSNDYMIRAKIIKVDENKNLFVIVLHHIVADGWSLEILLDEIATAYNALQQNQSIKLDSLPIQYADFAIWQRQNIKGEVLENLLAYWKNKLTGVVPLELPTDYQRPEIQSKQGSYFDFTISKDLKEGLEQLSVQQGATLFMTLLAAFKVLLSRYSGQTDICVGTPIAGRTHKEIETLIGFFVNTLALRSDLSVNIQFIEFLAQVKNTMLDAYAHQDTPFEQVVQAVGADRDLSRTPLFQVMFAFHNTDTEYQMELSGLEVNYEEYRYCSSKFDLSFDIEDINEGLRIRVEYCDDLFKSTTIKQMVGSFNELIKSIIENPNTKIGDLNILTEGEATQLNSFNETAKILPLNKTIDRIIDEVVEQYPDQTAIIANGKTTSYAELKKQADGIANILINTINIESETTIGVLSHRGAEMFGTIYGVWKAGGVYLPLHPELPVERLKILIEDSSTKVICFEKELFPTIKQLQSELSTSVKMICIDGTLGDDIFDINSFPINETTTIRRRYSNDNLAYIIYTSGSTGKPKGAMIEHKGLLNHLFAMIDKLNLDEYSIIAQNASQSFDISIWQMFVSMLTGGTVAVYEKDVISSPQVFVESIKKDKVTVLELVPSYLTAILDCIEDDKSSLTSLQYLLVTGETINRNLVSRWFNTFSNISMVNAYGPTEAADDVTLHFMTKTPSTLTIPIGKTLQNLKIYIVNPSGNLCPIGVKGEVWVAGVGVGRGYINDGAKTAASFIQNPFNNTPERLYKTGDLGRYLSDGTLEFFGRQDYQVKIRGHRIELGEIEQQISEIKGIETALVFDVASGNDNYLFAMIKTVDNTNLEIELIKQELSKALPDYMIPNYFEQIFDIPLTNNGKIDRKTLKTQIVLGESQTKNIVLPQNEVEWVLSSIWKKILNIEQISTTDNFFDCGGHSLKVTQLVSQIYKNLHAVISIKDVFTNPTIVQLANLINETQTELYLPIPTTPQQSNYDVSNAQRRLWIIDQIEQDLIAYNSYRIYKLNGELNIAAFSKAINAVVDRHEALRTTFAEIGGKPQQIIHDRESLGIKLEIVNYQKNSDTLVKHFEEISRKSMDLVTGPLFEAKLYVLSNDTYYFFCMMHHIICDGWSNNIFISELSHFYECFDKSKATTLNPLSIQYKDFSAWNLRNLSTEKVQNQKAYWLDLLEGELPVLEMPSYKNRPAVQTFDGQVITKQFSIEAYNKIKTLAKKADASLFMTLVALLDVLFHKYTSQKDFVFGTVTSGRNHPDLENQIGYYLNTVVLRNTLEPEENFESLLNRVKKNTLSSFDNQDYPFELLVNDLNLKRDTSRNPVFDVMVLLQNFEETEEDIFKRNFSGIAVEPIGIDGCISMFDLDFDFSEESGGLSLNLTFNTNIFDDLQMNSLLTHFEQLINNISNDSTQKIGEINIITTEDFEQIREFNRTQKELPLDLTYHHYLEKYALETPNKTAIIYNETPISYSELNKCVNKLARTLLNKNPIVKDDLAAVFLERSDKMAEAILSVWKTGGAYIPIERKYPDNRIVSILEDSSVKFVITERKLVSKELEERIQEVCPLYYIEDLLIESSSYDDTNLEIEIDPNSLSFVIFTSGSTGKPKGAMNEHIGMMNHALATVDYLKMDSDSVLVQNASHGFDISVWQFFTGLITGGTTLVCDDALVSNPELFIEQLIKQKATIFQVVPSYLSMLVDIIEKNPADYQLSLQNLICCGEAIKPALLRKWFGFYPSTIMINDYGPAEASDGTSWYIFNQIPAEMTNIPIGKSIYNMATYIVDDYMNICPIGVIGEICVAGIGVGRGYVNDPIRTSKVFKRNIFEPSLNQRLYKTGDIGRYLPNGLLEFHGRKDYQVKINGQRIELGEIETKLCELNPVKNAVVIDKQDNFGRKYLVGFVLLYDNFACSTKEIKEMLAKELPPYMIPKILQVVENIPITPNGKTDRKLLERKEITNDENSKSVIAPANEKEQALVDAWKQVLKKDEICISDNFYEIGGDSISAIQIAGVLYRQGLKVEVKEILRQMTIKAIAPFVRTILKVAEQGEITGEVPLTPIQQDFFDLSKKHPNYYNQSFAFVAKHRVDVTCLNQSIQKILEHHDILRASFGVNQGSIKQIIQPISSIIENNSCQVFDLMKCEAPDLAMKQYAEEIQNSFDLSKAPLIRFGLFQLPDADYLFICIHHLVIDGVSWRILIEDLNNLYEKTDVSLPIKTDSFKVWSERLTEYSKSNKLLKEEKYWSFFNSASIPQIPHSFDNQCSASVSQIQSCSFSLNEQYSEALTQDAHKPFKTNMNDLLLTAFGMATEQTFGHNATAIMMEGHGRVELFDDISTDRTVGWFTSEFPVWIESSKRKSLDQQIKIVKENLRHIPDSGIGYGLLKRKLALSNHFQILYNYLGEIDSSLEDKSMFQLLDDKFCADEHSDNQSDYPIEVIGLKKDGRITFTINYASNQFNQETIRKWANAYQDALHNIVDFCTNYEGSEFTPSDFEYTELSFDEFDELQKMFENA